MFCENCGSEMTGNGNYCSSCGRAKNKTVSRWARMSRLKKIIISIIIGFVVLQVLFFVIGFFMGMIDSMIFMMDDTEYYDATYHLEPEWNEDLEEIMSNP